MGQSPFARKGLFPQVRSNKRRSTRIACITPVVLSGKDASGKPFREETVTSIVNIHGAKLRTNHRVLVGMIYMLENPRTGQSGKAVCVQVFEAPSEDSPCDIAVQLVQPGNFWGVENPPPDWEIVAAELGGSSTAEGISSKRDATVTKPVPAAGVSATAGLGQAEVDSRLAEIEKRAAKLMDSVLQVLRIQAEAEVRNSLQELEKRLEDLLAGTDARLRERAEQARAELESTLETLRTEAMGETIREALQRVETRLATLSAEADEHIAKRAEQTLAELGAMVETTRRDLKTAAAETEAHLAQRAGQFVTELEAAGEASRRRLEASSTEAEARLPQRTDQALAEFEAALQRLRVDAENDLGARREQFVQSTEQALRARLAAIISTILAPAPPAPTSSQADPTFKEVNEPGGEST